MTSSAFREFRASVGDEDGVPVIAVPVENTRQAEVIRRAGGVPYRVSPSQNIVDLGGLVIDLGAAKTADDIVGLRAEGIDGIAVGSLGYGDNGGTPAERDVVYTIERDYGGVAVVSGGMNAVRILGFLENLGHADVVVTVHRGVFGHKAGAAAGVESLRLAARCRARGGDVFAFLKRYESLRGAFESFSGDADSLYPDWRS